MRLTVVLMLSSVAPAVFQCRYQGMPGRVVQKGRQHFSSFGSEGKETSRIRMVSISPCDARVMQTVYSFPTLPGTSSVQDRIRPHLAPQESIT